MMISVQAGFEYQINLRFFFQLRLSNEVLGVSLKNKIWNYLELFFPVSYHHILTDFLRKSFVTNLAREK